MESLTRTTLEGDQRMVREGRSGDFEVQSDSGAHPVCASANSGSAELQFGSYRKLEISWKLERKSLPLTAYGIGGDL